MHVNDSAHDSFSVGLCDNVHDIQRLPKSRKIPGKACSNSDHHLQIGEWINALPYNFHM